MQLELGPDHDDRSPGVVDALAQQVLPEAPALALQRVGEGLQRPLVGAAQFMPAPPVVEQGVHGLLQHALLVPHDHVGRALLEQPLQAVVAVDHAPVQVVEIGCRKASAVQRHQRPQLRRDDRQHLQDHPLRLVAGLAERLHDAQPLRRLAALLHRGLHLHVLAELVRESVGADVLEQLLDGLGPHQDRDFKDVIRGGEARQDLVAAAVHPRREVKVALLVVAGIRQLVAGQDSPRGQHARIVRLHHY